MKRHLGLKVPLAVVYGMLLMASLWLVPEPAQAWSQYREAFNTVYGTAESRLSTCSVCHSNPNEGGNRNRYGMAFENQGGYRPNPCIAINDDNTDGELLNLSNGNKISAMFFTGYASDPATLTVNTSGPGTVSRSILETLCGTSVFCYPNHEPNPPPNDPDRVAAPEMVTLTALRSVTPASAAGVVRYDTRRNKV